MPKIFTAKASDLSGATNPTGILSPSFLVLKQALDRGDEPENVRQALYDWLGQQKVTADQVDALLDLEPTAALSGLIEKIGAGMRRENLPPVVLDTLREALKHIALKYADREEMVLKKHQARLDRIKSQFVEGETPDQIVRDLLS